MIAPEETGHALVVIGASLGGLDALGQVAAGLPADFPAAVCVVQHLAASSPGHLADLLASAGPLPASQAKDGEPIRPGHVYVAPPDRHLIVSEGHLRTGPGPRENRVRPAIDTLFRSAAVAFGPRVIGVVLTGRLDDGAFGLRAVRRCGGVAVVQTPEDAVCDEMPRAALDIAGADHVVPLDGMGALLSRLVRLPPGAAPPIPDDLLLEARIAERALKGAMLGGEDEAETIGTLVPCTCPGCGGTLWSVDAEPTRFRCHLGHTYTAQALLADQDAAVERAVWAALRVVEERANMLRRMGRAPSTPRLGADFEARANELQQHAGHLRALLSIMATEPDPPGI